MTERKYSLSEIDGMRRAIHSLMTSHGEWQGGGEHGKSRMSYPPQTKDVEERLRTHLLIGTDPEELKAAARAHDE